MKVRLFSLIFFGSLLVFPFHLSAQQPVINSISPTAAFPGTSITINGSNFDAIVTNNQVMFGSTKAQVTAASSTQLTVSVPAGAIHYPVTVNTINGTAYSPQSFLPTFPAGNVNFNNRSFATALDATTGTSPEAVVFCDFDGDGKADIAAVNGGSSTFSVSRNLSTNGTFNMSAKIDFSTASNPFGIATGDVNGDGKPDVVISNISASPTISVFINTSSAGNISFAARVNYTTGTQPRGVEINDIDGDGKPDISFTNFSSNNFSVLRNTTTGGTLSFAAKVDFTTGNGPYYISVRDIDGDSKPDVAVTCQTPNYVSVFRNTSTPGNISFATRQDFTTGTLPRGIACGDVDGDGKADIATANYGTSNVSILRNTSTVGAISFATKIDLSLAPLAQPEHIAIGDLNGDGKPDLVVPDQYTGSMHVSVFRNTSVSGNITMAARITYATSNNPKYTAIGDLDGDGKADLSVACYGAAKISVFRNVAPPVVSSFSPASGPAGSSVTISGFNFRANPAENNVNFGGVKATVNTASNTSLTVTVPAGTTHLPITVTTDGLTGLSRLPFILTFIGGDSIISNSFAPRQVFTSGSSGKDATMADFDGDGKNDVAFHNYSNSTNSILRNTSTPGNVSFATPITVTNFSSETAALLAGDLNGNGKPELISAGGDANSINIYRNTSTIGSISFATYIQIGVSAEATNIYVADLNDDGRPDLIVDTKGYIVVIPNTSTTSTLSFGAAQLITMDDFRDKVAVADFDGDGKVDVVAGQSYMKNTSANGVISFGPLTNFAPIAFHDHYVTADFNGDGKPDIAELNRNLGRIRFYTNTSTTGNISFSLLPNSFTTGTYPVRMSVGDLNGDGLPDIAVANQDYDAVSVFANSSTAGTISFIPKVDYAAGHWPWAAAIGDLDGDAKPDLLVPNWQSQSFSVFRFSPDVLPLNIPEINSFLPLNGIVNDTISITGKNFSNTPQDNIVLFGTLKATVINATNNSIQVKIPTGASNKLFTVTNSAGLTGYSKKPFKVTFPGAGPVFKSNSFDTAKLFAAADNPWAICLGDLDGDGKNDVATANLNSNSVSIFRNTSNKGFVNFASKTDMPVGNAPKACTMADLNADGKPELLVANANDNTVMVFRNTSSPGTISFAAPVLLSTDSSSFGHPVAIAVHDLDGDGKPDVAVVNQNSFYIAVFRNLHSGIGNAISLGGRQFFNGGTYPRTISIMDMDGNGKPDMVIGTDGEDANILNNTSNVGTFSFTRGLKFANKPANGGVAGMSVVDLNLDDKPDIATASSGNGLTTQFNESIRGTNKFAPAENFGPNFSAKGIAHDDFDGDGRTDIAIPDLFGKSVAAYKNNFTPTDTPYFKLAVSYSINPAATGPITIASGDIDGDGKPDIITSVTVNYLENYLIVLKNKVGEAVPLCPNGGTTFSAGITSATYQWQLSLDNGTSFTNISNNANYSGATTATLQLTNIPSSWTGYQYKCILNNGVSETFTIRFINSWTGAMNNAWENPANWSCGLVPDLFTDVVINAGANIVLNSNTSIATLNINPDASFTVGAGYTLTLVGH